MGPAGSRNQVRFTPGLYMSSWSEVVVTSGSCYTDLYDRAIEECQVQCHTDL